MPSLVFDKFQGGLDVRPAHLLSRSDILRVLTNAYITTGRSIRKRPCLSTVAQLEAGTVGLKAGNGVLNTFYGQGAAITHANALFRANRIPHPTTGADPTKVNAAETFNGYLYVAAEYPGPLNRHHYLDDPGAWAAATTYAADTYVRPTAANGFRYKVTAGGGGASGGAEPTWPTTLGLTVIDGALTRTCAAFDITDTNCPHTAIICKRQQKIYSAGASPNQANVYFCATGDVRDWTTASDAGFLPAGLQASGSDDVTALGPFNRNLGIFFSDSAQIWTVNSDPADNAITATVENVGTIYARAAHGMAGDLFFLAQNGFRSLSLIQLTENLQDSDVGTAIDKLIKAAFAASDDPISIYHPKLGQWWCINGTTAWVYSFSRTGKLSAWSKFTFPATIDDATILNQELYLRVGDIVYLVSEDVYKDGSSDIPLVEVEMYFQDANRPNVVKQVMGETHICTGSPTVSYKFYDGETQQVLQTAEYELIPVNEPAQINPVEMMATRIAPVITHQADEEFELSFLSLLYENLGAVGS